MFMLTNTVKFWLLTHYAKQPHNCIFNWSLNSGEIIFVLALKLQYQNNTLVHKIHNILQSNCIKNNSRENIHKHDKQLCASHASAMYCSKYQDLINMVEQSEQTWLPAWMCIWSFSKINLVSLIPPFVINRFMKV
jgi:hypothetical protein